MFGVYTHSQCGKHEIHHTSIGLYVVTCWLGVLLGDVYDIAHDHADVHSLLEPGTMCVHDHEIKTPNIQGFSHLKNDIHTNM